MCVAARRMLAIRRYDYKHVRPHSSLGNMIPAKARRAMEQSERAAPGAFARPETDANQPQAVLLSTRHDRGQVSGLKSANAESMLPTETLGFAGDSADI